MQQNVRKRARAAGTAVLLVALGSSCTPGDESGSQSGVAPIECVELERQGRRGGWPYRHEYVFTEDWFTWNIPVWEQALAPFQGRPGLRYLEVGVFEGRSLFWVLENILTDLTSAATVIDPLDVDDYPELEDVFRRNLAIGGETDRVEIIKGYSQIALRHLPLGSFDIIYIDGSHAAADVLEDAILSWRLLKEEGVLIFDDYAWDVERPVMDKPMIAVNTFVQFFGGQMDLVHCGYQLVVRKRAPDSGMARED